MHEIGLFPLNIVLLPTERLPLHIFEDRYKEMIGRCLEHNHEFGLLHSEKSRLMAIGTTAAVVEVLNRYDDGRLDIVVEGRRRFRVETLTEGQSFMTAKVDLLPEATEAPNPEAAGAAIEAFKDLAEAAGADTAEVDPALPRLSFDLAARVELKQELLEMSDENERLLRLAEVLQSARSSLERSRSIRARAESNGRVEDL
jgi:Lon protease-like protein